MKNLILTALLASAACGPALAQERIVPSQPVWPRMEEVIGQQISDSERRRQEGAQQQRDVRRHMLSDLQTRTLRARRLPTAAEAEELRRLRNEISRIDAEKLITRPIYYSRPIY